MIGKSGKAVRQKTQLDRLCSSELALEPMHRLAVPAKLLLRRAQRSDQHHSERGEQGHRRVHTNTTPSAASRVSAAYVPSNNKQPNRNKTNSRPIRATTLARAIAAA